MAKQKVYRFQVTGIGEFPLDMLRYDRCWPDTEEDAGAIANSFTRGFRGTITLRAHNAPTNERWSSFLWRVVDIQQWVV